MDSDDPGSRPTDPPPSDPAERVELDELATLLTEGSGDAAMVAPNGALVHLPPAVYEVLSQVIAAMRAGRAITIAPLALRLTTQEAADLLGISRPTLIKLLEDGQISFEQPGRHRRVRLDDLLACRESAAQVSCSSRCGPTGFSTRYAATSSPNETSIQPLWTAHWP